MCLGHAIDPIAASTRPGVPELRANTRVPRVEPPRIDSSTVGNRVEAVGNSSEVFALQIESAHHDFVAVMIGSGVGAYPRPGMDIRLGGNTNAAIGEPIAALRGRHRDFG
jgi:hypothetical protein